MDSSDSTGDSALLVTPTEILDRSISDLPSKDLVVALRKKNKKKGSDFNRLKYSVNDKDFFIKYNNATMNEAHSQLFFYNQILKKSDATIRIPKIYHAFETDDQDTYIIMEHIDIDFEKPASDEQRAQAISELISIPPPPGIFGSITGDNFMHHFFQDHRAPLPFTSATELADYINIILEHFNKYTKKGDKVDFSDEPLLCYYSDIRRCNFPVDTHGQLWVVDFKESGVPPASFMNFTIRAHPIRSLPISIRKTIPLEKSKKLGAMGRASYLHRISVNNWHLPPDE